MQRDPKRLIGGTTRLTGGVNNGRASSLIAKDEVAFAVNVTFRDGFPHNRPGWNQRPLRFSDGEAGHHVMEKRFQGSGWYDDFNDREKLVVSIGGRIFIADPFDGFVAQEITPTLQTTTTADFTVAFAASNTVQLVDASRVEAGLPIRINGLRYDCTAVSGSTVTVTTREAPSGTIVAAGSGVTYLDRNNPNLPLVWMQQAEQYLVIQDGQSLPIIFDGSKSWRSKGLPGREVPTGTVMAYGIGRLWVAISDRDFVGGDIVGGPTGVLGFAENAMLAGGGAFRVNANSGKIRSMKFVANLDTSLGQGPLQVLTERAIYSVNTPISREDWALVTNPIQTTSLINFGAMSHASTVIVNGDLFFRAYDGLRSFVIARRDFATWGNTPLSREMKRVMSRDSKELLVYGSAVLFENRLLFTCNPMPGPSGIRHRGLIALDFETMSTVRNKVDPVYEGVWTGFQPYQLVAGMFGGRERCFAFAASVDQTLELWELTVEAKNDNRYARIQSSLELAAETFEVENSAKRLSNAELTLSRISGSVDLDLRYRPDQYPILQIWGYRNVCTVDEDCDTETEPACKTPFSENLESSKSRLGFGRPPETNNLSDEKPMQVGYEFNLWLRWTGFAEIRRLAVHAIELDEVPTARCDDRSVCHAVVGCNPDPFGYRAACSDLQAPVVDNHGNGGITLAWWSESGVTYLVHRVKLFGGVYENQLIATYSSEAVTRWRTEILDESLVEGTTGDYYLVAEPAGACRTRTSAMMTLTYAG
jgi:hypothetical protein